MSVLTEGMLIFFDCFVVCRMYSLIGGVDGGDGDESRLSFYAVAYFLVHS